MIVCAYTLARLDDTVAAVRSVLVQEPPPAEVVVVVDHNEELRAALSERLGDDAIIVANREQQGLSGARNTGVRASTGDIAVFLDDDATARPGWLSALTAPFASREVIGVGGHAIPRWEAEPPRWFPGEFLWVVGCSYDGMVQAGPARNPIGCNMAFRRDAFVAAGVFASGVGRIGRRPLGCEETEFAIRARRAMPGSRVEIAPDAVVDHLVPATRGSVRYFVSRCYGEGLSKAVIRALCDEEATEAERRYAARTLPAGVRRELRSALAFRDPLASVARVGALIGGLAVAGAGFVRGRLGTHRGVATASRP